MQIPDNKKITVVFRVEPGCLGPEGDSLVEKFCVKANLAFANKYAECIKWQVVPRHDKTLPELDYMIQGRPLSRDHAKRFLDVFKLEIDKFEMESFDLLPDMIDEFFGR